jgi:putative membrane protein
MYKEKTIVMVEKDEKMNRKTSTLISIGLSAVLIALGVWFLFSHMGIWTGSERWLMGHHRIMGGGMGIIMIIFWILIIGAFVLLISDGTNRIRVARQPDEYRPDALEILKQRYARGEIDRTEYEEKRRVLSS